MLVTILDTNVLRGAPDEVYDDLVALERAKNVRQYADVWTLMELTSHLVSRTDSSYVACRKAITRYVERAIRPRDVPPRVVAPAEVQVSRLVFGDISEGDSENMSALFDLADRIATADWGDDLHDLLPAISEIASHVAKREEWFARYFTELRGTIESSSASHSASERNAAVRSFTRSAEAQTLDAIAMIERALRQSGRAPSELTEEMIRRVMQAVRAGSVATGLALERIVCDRANLEQSRIRNLLWDQEIAINLGNRISGLPIMVVSDDSYFGEAARLAGTEASVCSLAEYLALLRRAT